jgi:hypothetical protein
VTKQYFAEPANLGAKGCGPTADYTPVFRRKLLRRPSHDFPSLFWKGAALHAGQLR